MHESEIWKFKFDFSGIGPRHSCLGPAEAMASDAVIRVIGWRFNFATKKHFEERLPIQVDSECPCQCPSVRKWLEFMLSLKL